MSPPRSGLKSSTAINKTFGGNDVFSHPNDIKRITAKKYNLMLIEDCCEDHGATYKGKKVGTFGDMSLFSFYYGRHITTIEGGMICTDNEEIYELARMYRSHGMTREASKATQ